MLNTNWAQMPTTASKLQLNVGVLELNSSEVTTEGGIMENSVSNCRRHDHQLVTSAMLSLIPCTDFCNIWMGNCH
jgi:CO dehydrogenase/acetyl-CoA synthase alpha subunit